MTSAADTAHFDADVFADEYAESPERTPVVIAAESDMFIGGKFVPAKSGRRFPTLNPAREDVLSDIADGGAADVDRAVAAARKAQPKWAKLEPSMRATYLFRLARRIQERSRELAVLEAMDGGKPIREARDVDLPLVAQYFFYYAGWCDKLKYAFHGAEPTPMGVCAQIIPWNFPLMMLAWKIAPALACGNTVVLKPAETTSLTALRFAEIARECDIPPGVINIVTGGPVTGRALAEHPDIDKLAFTGSTPVGRLLAKTAAKRGLPLTLELGGKSPHIIFDDAPIDQAVEGVIQGIYFNQGQVCCAGSRLFVQESILDDVIRRIDRRLRTLRVGDPLDKNTDIGAINSAEQLATIRRYLKTGEEEGAVVHTANVSRLPDTGFWCQPSFLTGVQPDHVVAREEIFGPVLAVMSFRTPDEAIERANDSEYGLAAGIWTDKGSRMFEIAARLKAGVVWCNTFNRFDAASPFGGVKQSGFGREGGMHGLRPYVRV